MSIVRNFKNYLQDRILDDQKYQSDFVQSEWFETRIDDYNLIDLIGFGSFGRVYRAECKRFAKKECAIKCISKRQAFCSDKILNEIYIHIRLSHPNILKLFTVLEDREIVYLVTELCQGRSLANLIQEKVQNSSLNLGNSFINSKVPVLPFSMIAAIILQLCDALDYLHRNSIVHRDINLNNILLIEKYALNANVRIKLADFGLAIDFNSNRNYENTDFGSTICGTPGFISPEVLHQKSNVSSQSDIFSLGSVIYACVSGQSPKNCTVCIDRLYEDRLIIFNFFLRISMVSPLCAPI